VLAVVLVVVLLFTGRLLQVQALDANDLAAAALGNRLVPVKLPAERGTITDRNGSVLARSVERRNITADPTLFTPSKDYPHPKFSAARAAARLAPLLGMDAAAVAATLTGNGRTHFAYVAKGVTPQVWRQVQALGVQGLYSERADQRTYPAGSVAGNLVGFLGKDGTPLAGLEYAENKTLTGKDGSETYERGRDGQRIPAGSSTYSAPVDGSDVRLTLDEDLQWYAQQAITAQVAKTGAEWGTVVALTPDGQVLALAESGSVDPNDPGATPVPDRGNRALEATVEPGSTGKVITAAAAIQEGLVEPDTHLTVPGLLPIPHTTPIHDSHAHGDEKLTFAGVLGESSNIGTVMVGRQLGKQKFYDYLRAFGVGSKQLGLPGETAGILAAPGDWDGRQQYTVLFGQGYGVNVLQAAQVYATIANGGVRVQPHVIAGTTDSSGTYHPTDVGAGTRVVSADTAKKVVGMLEGAVGEEGTGNSASVPGFRVAGKTGTADDLAAEAATHTKQYTSSFIGMAPAEDPQVVLAVTLQHPQTDYFGGTVAAPVFSSVMSYALQQRDITPSGTKPDLVPLSWG
jgi:cell division protein FtsI (penicillin-binding protein 3)